MNYEPAVEARLAQLSRVFTPSTPVTQAAVFAGRASQQAKLRHAIFEPGRHAVIYGSRGVGKTSLANLVKSQLEAAEAPPEIKRYTLIVRCTRDDDYDSLWTRVAQSVSVTPIAGAETVVSDARVAGERTRSDIAAQVADSSDFVTPPMVCRLFNGARRAVFIFDEFDAIRDEGTREAFADTLKQMSDMPDSPTVVLIGVASDIGALVGHHESIQRCTEQVFMPLMAEEEVVALVRNGFALLDGLDIEAGAVNTIVWLSRGYPAFAHSMAKAACEIAIRGDKPTVGAEDVLSGALSAIESVPYSLGETYKVAADSRHPSDATASTLHAAALCGERFRPSEVLAVLTRWQRPVTLKSVADHLKKLALPERGSVLIRHGDVHPAYEFRDPMFVPYIVIRTAPRDRPLQ